LSQLQLWVERLNLTGKFKNVTPLSLQRDIETICVLKYCRQVGQFCKTKVVQTWPLIVFLYQSLNHKCFSMNQAMSWNSSQWKRFLFFGQVHQQNLAWLLLRQW